MGGSLLRRGHAHPGDAPRSPLRRYAPLLPNFSALIVVGYVSLADVAFGLDTTKCWGEPQPQAAVTFIHYTFALVTPIMGVGTAALVHWFPIQGERLAQLETNILKLCEEERSGGGATRV